MYPVHAHTYTHRDGEVETHEKEKITKNEFLDDLQQLDSGKMEAEVF